MVRSKNRFKKGSGCFECKVCKKQTRDTGDNGALSMCPLCFERSATENTFIDNDAGEGWMTALNECKTVEQVLALTNAWFKKHPIG